MVQFQNYLDFQILQLNYIYKIDKGELVDEPEIEIPEDLRFNENGNLIKDKE